MTVRARELIFLVALALALAPGAGGAEPPAAPNVLLIVADDLRPDALAGLGNGYVRTPNLDALAARGLVLSRATCGYPICHVSRAELFTGRALVGSDMPGARRGVTIAPQWTLWPEHMRQAGWHTVYSGKWHVAGTPRANGFVATAGLFSSGGAPAGVKATFPQTPAGRDATGYLGWTFKDERGAAQPELGVGLTPDTDRIIADRAVEAIGRMGGKRFFLEVAFTAPHDPRHWPAGRERELDARAAPLPRNFRAAPEFDTGNIDGRDEKVVPAPRTADEVKAERAIYFSLVQNLDAQVGRLVRALEETGQLGRTIVIFTSDHGLALGSHGLMGKQNQFEHTINVPLIVSGPGVVAGRRSAVQCYLRDLFPTVCALAGLPVPASVEGRSLRGVWRGEEAEVHEAIFGYFTDAQRMVRRADGWKLIWYPKIERLQLFNVRDDPDELRDRAAEPAQHARVAELKEQLVAWLREHGDPVLRPR